MSSDRTDSDRSPPFRSLVDSVLTGSRVSLRFVIGRAKLPTSQVMSLAVGQIVPLDRPISSRVTLDLEGITVGQGELVAVDGRRGVRVIRLDDPVP